NRARDVQGLQALNRKEPRADKKGRETIPRMLSTIDDAPAMRKAVTASGHQTPQSPESQEGAQTENNNVEKRQDRLSQNLQQGCRNRYDGDLVMEVDDALLTRNQFGNRHEGKEGEHR